MAQMKYFYELTISSSPHVHSPVTTKTIMRDVLIGLAPALIGSVFLFDAGEFEYNETNMESIRFTLNREFDIV